jgi:hypothetical protein
MSHCTSIHEDLSTGDIMNALLQEDALFFYLEICQKVFEQKLLNTLMIK